MVTKLTTLEPGLVGVKKKEDERPVPVRPSEPRVPPPPEPIEEPELEPEDQVTVDELLGRIYEGFEPITLKFIKQWAAEEPEAFLTDIQKRGRTEDTELLLELFGARPEDIEEFFAPPPAPEPIKIPEGGFKFVEEIEGVRRQFTINKDYSVELEGTVVGKYNPDTGVLESWGTQRLVLPVDGVRELVTVTPDSRAYDENNNFVGTYNSVTKEIDKVSTKEKASEVWDALIFGSRQMLELGENFFLSTLPNLVFGDVSARQRESLGDEWADRVNAQNVVIRDKFRSAYTGNKVEYEIWLDKNIELQPRLDYAEGITKHFEELYNDPWYWAYEFANIVPFVGAVVASSITAGALTGGNPLAMIAGGAAIVYPVETQSVFEALVANGAPEQQAAQIAAPAGIIIASLESIGRLPLLKAVSPHLMRLFRKEAANELGKLTARQLAVKGIKTGLSTEAVEVLTETLQEATQNAAVKIVNENQSIFENLDVIAGKTAVATAPLALFGGGVSMRRVAPSETQGFTDIELEAKGFVKEPDSDTWFQPIEVTEEKITPIEPKPEVPKVEPVEPVVTPEVPAVPEVEVIKAELDVSTKDVRASVLKELEKEAGLIGGTLEQELIDRNEGKAFNNDDLATLLRLIPDPEPSIDTEITFTKSIKPQDHAVLRKAVLFALTRLEGRPIPRIVHLRTEVLRELGGGKARTNQATGEVWITFNARGVGREKLGIALGDRVATTFHEMVHGVQELEGKTNIPAITPKPPPAVPDIAKKPLPKLPEQTPEEVTTNLTTIGQPKLTPKQITRTLDLFGKYVGSESTLDAWELTRDLRRETRAGQAENLEARTEELIISEGIGAEEAMNQAKRETMAGELPAMRTDYLSDLTNEMREALFNKVYQTLKEEPFEMMSTSQALTNALLGKAIPREPGIRGGSAFTRLQRVFGDQPKVLKAIEKMAKEKKPLEDVVEGIFRETGQAPTPIDEDTADYLRGLKTDVIYTPTEFREPIPVTKYEPAIEDDFKEIPLWPVPVRDNVIKVLRELGWSPVDIGNFLRANKASFDFSFWRQQAPLIASHPISFAQANVEAWKSIWSQKSAEASWQRITQDPLFQIYEFVAEEGGDFLRPLGIQKGTSQWRGTEEFGYLTGERLIPRLTAKIPWVKISARAFETGTNEHNWLIFKNYYKAMLKLGEQYASGKKKLKPGEVFNIQKEMVDFSKSLANFSARGSLGKFQVAAPELSALFFAPRMAIGRILSVADLVNANPRVRAEAWKNAASFVSTFGGIVLLGAYAGWWDVEKDPKSAEYMSIRIGTTRIDPWGGFRQFLVFFTRAITGTGVSSVTGAEYTPQPLGLVRNLLRGKAAPLASIMLDFWIGKNFVGEEVDVANKRQWAERLAPFAVWDIYEAYDEDPTTALQVAIPAIVGAGVQTYTGDWRENFPKLGLPKYSDNLVYGITEPYYDTADFWTDTSSQFKGVDPETLTKEKGFPPYIKAIAEARIINEHLSTLPNEKLVNLNADPAEGTTFAQYRQMWADREAIVASGDEEKLKEFDQDERTRNAQLGNFSQIQFALLNEYWAITDKVKQAEFLKKHKAEIGVNQRQDWLRSHPKENAQLAVWGQEKILTKEAYTRFKSLIKSLDIPDNAIPPLTLPPETSIDTHFTYEEMVDEGTHSSVEAELLLLKDQLAAEEAGVQSYVDWRTEGGNPLTLSDKPIEHFQLRVDNQELFDKLEEVREIENEEEKEEAIEAIRSIKVGDETFHDIERRVEATGMGTRDAPIADEVVNSFVEYRGMQDEEGVGASTAEVLLFRVDDSDLNDFLMDENIWGDNALEPIPPEDIPRLRLIVKGRDKEAQYQEIDPDAKNPDTGLLLRDEFLDANDEFRKDRRTIEAYEKEIPDNLIMTFVAYYEEPEKGFRRERMLINDDGSPTPFGTIWHELLGKDLPIKVPSVRYDEITEANQELFDEVDGLGKSESIHYIEDVDDRKARYQEIWFNPDGTATEFYRAFKRREAYAVFVPEFNPDGTPTGFIENYIQWFVIKAEGKPDDYPEGLAYYEDDFFMMEHQDFYKNVYLNEEIWGSQNERLDFRLTPPTRIILEKWIAYNRIRNDQTARDQFRLDNPDLDEWGVSVGIWVRTMSERRRRKGLTATELFEEELAERQEEFEETLEEIEG